MFCHIVCSPNRIRLNINSRHTDRALLKRAASPGYSTIFFILGYVYCQIGEVIVREQRLTQFPLSAPPPLSPVSDFVSLAICSHCAALPDGRHSGRLGSVNCKGMWHSVLKLRMFLWISGVRRWHFFCFVFFPAVQNGESASAQVNTEHVRGFLFSVDGDTVCAISNDTRYHKSVLKHAVLHCCRKSGRSTVWPFYDYPQLRFASFKLSRGKRDELFIFPFRNVSITECARFFTHLKQQ